MKSHLYMQQNAGVDCCFNRLKSSYFVIGAHSVCVCVFEWITPMSKAILMLCESSQPEPELWRVELDTMGTQVLISCEVSGRFIVQVLGEVEQAYFFT